MLKSIVRRLVPAQLRRLRPQLFRPRALDASKAYDLWADCYDDDRNNLLLAMDEELFGALLRQRNVKNKIVVDVGCGTGRHWKMLLAGEPAQLMGYDASSGMLDRLLKKHPNASVRLARDHRLADLSDGSCDLVVSTLTLCHLPDHRAALADWSRVLKPAGEIVLTDFHPMAAKHGDVTFRHQGAIIAIRHYVHPLKSIIASASSVGLDLLRMEERRLDHSYRRYYEAKNALATFYRIRGIPMMYGLHFRKRP